VLLAMTASGNLLAYQAFDREGVSKGGAMRTQQQQQKLQQVAADTAAGHSTHSVLQQGDVEMAEAGGSDEQVRDDLLLAV